MFAIHLKKKNSHYFPSNFYWPEPHAFHGLFYRGPDLTLGGDTRLSTQSRWQGSLERSVSVCFWILTTSLSPLLNFFSFNKQNKKSITWKRLVHILCCFFFFSCSLHSYPHVWTHTSVRTQAVSPWRARRSPKPTGPGCEHPSRCPKPWGWPGWRLTRSQKHPT